MSFVSFFCREYINSSTVGGGIWLDDSTEMRMKLTYTPTYWVSLLHAAHVHVRLKWTNNQKKCRNSRIHSWKLSSKLSKATSYIYITPAYFKWVALSVPVLLAISTSLSIVQICIIEFNVSYAVLLSIKG